MRILPSASVLPTLFITPVWAAPDFQLTSGLAVEQTYTDNVSLAPQGQQQSDFVTSVRPTVSLGYNGRYIKLTATYTPEILYYANDGAVIVRNQFSLVPSGGSGNSLQLVDNLLYLDVNGNVAQYNNSVSGPLASTNISSSTNINTTLNQSTVSSILLSPYLRYNFSNQATAEVRYTYSFVASNAPSTSFADSGSNRLSAVVSSGSGYRYTGWSLLYSSETINYASGGATTTDTKFQNFQGTLRHEITPFVSAFASAGYEDNGYQTTTGQSPSGGRWEAGVNWTPSPRTNLTASTGRRYFGSTNTLSFTHRTRLTTWSLSRTQDITTTRSQFLQPTQADTATYLDSVLVSRIPDPVERQRAVQQEIARLGLPPTMLVPVNFLTNQIFLQNAWQGSVAFQGLRHTFVMNVFTSDRESQTPALPAGAGDFAQSASVEQSGGSFVWNWRLTPYTSSNLTLGASRSSTPGTGREDEYRYFRTGFTTQLGSKTSGNVSYSHVQNDSNVAGGAYRENRVTAVINTSF